MWVGLGSSSQLNIYFPSLRCFYTTIILCNWKAWQIQYLKNHISTTLELYIHVLYVWLFHFQNIILTKFYRKPIVWQWQKMFENYSNAVNLARKKIALKLIFIWKYHFENRGNCFVFSAENTNILILIPDWIPFPFSKVG